MGKITAKLANRKVALSAQRPSGLDRWLTRASHAAQVLLLALGVFGYFYTVLALYQKALLDEEIAKKTIELGNKERQIAALAVDIDQRTLELRKRDAALAVARKDASVAKIEAQGRYASLRAQYVGNAMNRFRRCSGPVIDRGLLGTELEMCPKAVEADLKHMLDDLKPQDRSLLMSLLVRTASQLDPEFQTLLATYTAKNNARQTQIANVEKQIALRESEKPKDIKAQLAQVTDLMELRIQLRPTRDEANLKYDTYSEFRKLLDRGATHATRDYFERVSP